MSRENYGVGWGIFSVVPGLLLSANAMTAEGPSLSAETIEKLREEIHAKFDGIILEYDARIESVDWRNDLATIVTQSPIRKYKPPAGSPFNQTNQFQPFSPPLSRDETSSLNTRKPLKGCGTLKFIDEDYSVSLGDDEIFPVHPEYDPE